MVYHRKYLIPLVKRLLRNCWSYCLYSYLEVKVIWEFFVSQEHKDAEKSYVFARIKVEDCLRQLA